MTLSFLNLLSGTAHPFAALNQSRVRALALASAIVMVCFSPTLAAAEDEPTAFQPRLAPIWTTAAVETPAAVSSVAGRAEATTSIAPALQFPVPVQPRVTLPGRLRSSGRPLALPVMYASLGVLQGLDLYSTRVALENGAVEANPVMAGLVGNWGAATAFKAATTGATVFLVEKMWKRNRAAAIGVLAAVNGMTAFVVAHNMRVASQARALACR